MDGVRTDSMRAPLEKEQVLAEAFRKLLPLFLGRVTPPTPTPTIGRSYNR